jgi:hypothetical protein
MTVFEFSSIDAEAKSVATVSPIIRAKRAVHDIMAIN